MLSWLRLIRSRRVGPGSFLRLMTEYGSAAAALEALPKVAQAAGVRDYAPCSRDQAEAEMAAAHRVGAVLLCLGDPRYPAALADISDAPPMLWCRGALALLARPAVALVGARNASSLGVRTARMLAAGLGEAGFTVVSGLARGIDAAAHEASLAGGTVAVLAGGVDVIYPPENAPLADRIAAHGLLMSEQPMGLAPQARHFPRRNRIVSGLALGVVVVEGATRSGSLITAGDALEQGREVMAVPGHPFDARAGGCNALIRDGATLVRSTADITAALGTRFGPAALPAPPDRPTRRRPAATGATAQPQAAPVHTPAGTPRARPQETSRAPAAPRHAARSDSAEQGPPPSSEPARGQTPPGPPPTADRPSLRGAPAAAARAAPRGGSPTGQTRAPPSGPSPAGPSAAAAAPDDSDAAPQRAADGRGQAHPAPRPAAAGAPLATAPAGMATAATEDAPRTPRNAPPEAMAAALPWQADVGQPAAAARRDAAAGGEPVAPRAPGNPPTDHAPQAAAGMPGDSHLRRNPPVAARRPADEPTLLPPGSALSRAILDRLGPSPLAEDQLIRDLDLPVARIAPELLLLELEGRVARQPGGLLARVE